MRTDPQMRIRLPDDCKKFIEVEAEKMASSQNAIVVRAIREMMDRQNENRPSTAMPDRLESKTA
jgi:predicted transcriptional regulator